MISSLQMMFYDRDQTAILVTIDFDLPFTIIFQLNAIKNMPVFNH
jgi:hypothetical protein